MQSCKLLLIVTLLGVAWGFDTGHHRDLTSQVLARFNYSADAIAVVGVENWFVDFFSSFPDEIAEKFQVEELELLHFDSLLNSTEIELYWHQLAINTKNAVQTATLDKNVLHFLSLIGMSLHAVQDFYTHSNWNEHFPRASCDCYRSDTFWNHEGDFPSANLYTGVYNDTLPRGDSNSPQHGSYCQGVNKDSYARHNWDEAQTFAYVATFEWVNAIHQWSMEIEPSFADQAKQYVATGSDKNDLDQEVAFALEISMYIKTSLSGSNKGQDGHWKGPGSGSLDSFGVIIGPAASLTTPYRDIVLKEKLHFQLADKLYTFNVTEEVPEVPKYTITDLIVVVRTFQVDSLGLEMNPPDFYLNVTVDSMIWREATQSNQVSIQPKWTTFAYVPETTGTVSILLELFDEDVPGGDDQYDINPGDKDNISLTYDIHLETMEGDITGIHNDSNSAVESKGTGDHGARILFFITTRTIGQCQGTNQTVLRCFEGAIPRICEPTVGAPNDATSLLSMMTFVLVAALTFIVM